MAKGIENRARSPPAVFDFATSQIQKHGGTKMYYDQKESGKRIANLRKKEGLTQEQLAEKLSISYSLLAKVESGSRAASIDLLVEMKAFFNTTLDYLALGIEPMTEPSKHEDMVCKNQAEQKIAELEQKFKELKEIIL